MIGISDDHGKIFQNSNEDALLNLLPVAIRNKVPLLFLERALNRYKYSKSLKPIYENYTQKSRIVLDLIEEMHRNLTRTKIDYALFKTIKPFPFTTVDLDVLLFSREDLMRACHTLRRRGSKLAGYGAYSITLYSPQHDINIDLHLEVSVSHMIYINKNLIQKYVTEVNTNGSQACGLEPPAELAMVLAHSLYKEQMFTLADYYTTITQISNMTEHQRRTLVDLAEQIHIGLSLKLALKLIHFLTIRAFGKDLPAIIETAQMIQVSEIEEKTIQIALSHFIHNVRLPYKYHPIAVALALTTKSLKDPVMRATMAQQFVEIVANTSKFLESTLLHIKRETY